MDADFPTFGTLVAAERFDWIVEKAYYSLLQW